MKIIEILEIFLSVLAVFGGYSILDMVRFHLLYPKSVRKNVRGAVILDNIDTLPETVGYVKYLRKENKISGERLIILVKDDIIEGSEDFSRLKAHGEVFKYVNYEERHKDEKLGSRRE